MLRINENLENEMLEAMDSFCALAEQLIYKLIHETDQPEKAKILTGHYYEIQHAGLLNGQLSLSDNWDFEVHGEHCRFENLLTGQILEVSLIGKEDVTNLDPYFFNEFLRTTEDLKYLAQNFKNGFKDTLDFFQELERRGKMVWIFGVEYRKV